MNSRRCSWRNSGSFGAYDIRIKTRCDKRPLRRERKRRGNGCLTYIYSRFSKCLIKHKGSVILSMIIGPLKTWILQIINKIKATSLSPQHDHIMVYIVLHMKKKRVEGEENVSKPLCQKLKKKKNQSLQKCLIMFVSFYQQDDSFSIIFERVHNTIPNQDLTFGTKQTAYKLMWPFTGRY